MGASKGQREDAVAILLLVEDHEAHDVGSRGLDVKTRVRWAWEAARKSGVKLRFLSVNVSENTLNGKHGLQLQSEVGPILVELLRRSRMAAGRLLPRLAKTLGIFLHVDAGSAGRAAEAMLVAAVFATDLSVKAGVPVLVLGRPPGRAPRAVAALVAHISDLAPVSAEAAAAQVEAASDTSKDDEAEQAVETSPSSPSDADDASANVRAEDVPEDKDSLAASKGDGGFREEVSGSDALQLDGAGEVASALAAMMSAVGGLQKSIGSLEEVELPIDSAPLAVEEKDDRPAPGGVAEILAGLNAAMGSLREEAPEAPAPAAEQELSLEELEDRVLLQKVLVKQLRSDYEARFERSQSLQQALDDLGTEPQELQAKGGACGESCQFCHMAHDQAHLKLDQSPWPILFVRDELSLQCGRDLRQLRRALQKMRLSSAVRYFATWLPAPVVEALGDLRAVEAGVQSPSSSPFAVAGSYSPMLGAVSTLKDALLLFPAPQVAVETWFL
eukprot:s29_g44.t4